MLRHELKAEQLRATEAYREHMKLFRKERAYLYSVMQKSQRSGNTSPMFIEIDSMDQAKTLLPHFAGGTPKNVNGNLLLNTHLTCVRYNGHRPDDIYYYTNTLPHDSATTCTVIYQTILKVTRFNGHIAPSLYAEFITITFFVHCRCRK